jgi:hypothetical protein
MYYFFDSPYLKRVTCHLLWFPILAYVRANLSAYSEWTGQDWI